MSSAVHARARDILGEGVRYVLRRPLRSLLTAFTCAIAIAVTVNVVSLTYGMDEDIQRDVDRFGRRTVDVGRMPVLIPGGDRPVLGPAEAEDIRRRMADLGARIVPRRQAVGAVTGDVHASLSIVAVPPDYPDTLDIPVRWGRWMKDGEDGAALDAAAVQRLFPDVPFDDVIGRSIDVEVDGSARTTHVVGILEDPLRYRDLFESFDEGRGARTLTSSLLSFRNVYLPASALGSDGYTGISVVVPTEASVDEVRRRLLAIWPHDARDPASLLRGGIGVFARRDWMAALGASTHQGALLGNVVWIIVVLVAAVMISTLNLITIRERYDELAVRRCEGARRRDVALQVTAEGVLTALAGGLAGLPLGYAGAELLRGIVDFPFRFEARYALAATGVAVLLGLLASVVPARRAARLQPASVLGRRLT